VTYEPDLDRALEGADAVIALRLQRERQEAGLLPSLREYSRVWGLTAERVARMQPRAPVMHPGPMNEGIEIDSVVAHGAQSLIETQVTNGVAVRMALLYLLAGAGTAAPVEERA
jgi:aspartate carbamoyltransferase catalytic subunit